MTGKSSRSRCPPTSKPMTKRSNIQAGFIGLGNMGNPMAANLIKAGHHLTVLDLDREKAENLEAAGAKWAETPLDVAARSDVVLTALPGPSEVEAVVLGDDGIFAGLSEDTVYIDTSTNAPDTMRKIASIGGKQGVQVLDAPVSGGVFGAQAGTLTIFVGGNEKTMERCRSLLESIGRHIVFMGPSGNGNITKLINNVMMFVNFVGVCEGMAMGAKAGIDLRKLRDTITPSMGQSAIFERVLNVFLSGDNFAHTTHMAIKDMRLVTDLGRQLGVLLMLSPMVEDVFTRFRDDGHGEKDFTEVMRHWLRRSGVDVSGYPKVPIHRG